MSYEKLKRRCEASMARLNAEHVMVSLWYRWKMATHAESPLPSREQSRLFMLDEHTFDCPTFDTAVENIAKVYNALQDEIYKSLQVEGSPVIAPGSGMQPWSPKRDGCRKANTVGWILYVCEFPPEVLQSSIVIGGEWKVAMSLVWPLYVDNGYTDTCTQGGALNALENFLLEADYDIITET